MNQPSMIDALQDEDMRLAAARWTPPESLPDLSRHKVLFFDFETDGLDWAGANRPIGLAVHFLNSAGEWEGVYLPWGHKGGGNLSEDRVKDWARRELRHKHLINVNTKFDIHMSRKWGVDLEAQGNTFADVAHYAALLDDHRMRFNQQALVKDFLGDEAGKVHEALGFTLDPRKFAEYPAGIVAPRALDDVFQVRRLHEAMWPQLEEQDLLRVVDLECQIIPVVCEMEWNGAPIDVPMLDSWLTESARHLDIIIRRIAHETGVNLRPNNNTDWEKLFQTLRLPHTGFTTDKGSQSFADEALAGVRHPIVQMGRHARNLASLRSKFLENYRERIGSDGILRYELHQLRAGKDQYDENALGTVSGRFSSADVNVQQVMTLSAQKLKHLLRFTVRKLFKPQSGLWFVADAKQIEYRLFVHYANSKALLDAYRADPNTDYHKIVQRLLETKRPNMERRHVKIVNFATIYGAGKAKFATMLGLPQEEADVLRDTYFAMFPEVRPLLNLASSVAMPGHAASCYWGERVCRREHRGYVRTYLGRRARFGEHDRHYSALNRIIQGTAADVNKRVLIEVHKNRKDLEFLPRFTVHDELDGDLQNPSKFDRMKELLNTQYYPDLKVPILWDTKIGDSWACKD